MLVKEFDWFNDWWGQIDSLRVRPWMAVLLVAPPGLQVDLFARELVASRLCQSPEPNASACGTCPSCAWVMQGQHPDMRWLRPDAEAEDEESGSEEEGSSETKKPSKEVRIDQVRGLLGFSQISSHRGAERLALIGPIQTLNQAASNALLKGLEEPAPGMRFVLYGAGLRGVPSTIISRCRRLTLSAPSALVMSHREAASEVDPWLLPLLASGRVDVVRWAERAEKVNPALVLSTLQLWLLDLSRVMNGLPAAIFPAQSASLASQAGQIGPSRLARVTEAQTELQQLVGRAGHPLNPKLFFETIFGTFSRAYDTRN